MHFKSLCMMTAIAIALTPFTAFSQEMKIKGEGAIVRQELHLPAFEEIAMAIDARVIVTQGSPQKVVVEGQQNIIDNLRKEVKGDAWNISFIKDVTDSKPLLITITMATLDEVLLSGSGSVETTHRFKNLDDVDLKLSGSGMIIFDMEANSTDAALSGSGKIKMAGTTNSLDVAISGSGDILASDLVSKDCDVAISGSGNAEVHVNGSLDSSIAGSGDIYYSGNANVTSRIVGSGNVRKK